MVQQMRRMREAGDFGDILVVQGTYSQDWMLYQTDWNWRVDPAVSGASRVMADIGSHFFDMAEHVTGLKVTAVCSDFADLLSDPQTAARWRGDLLRQAWVQRRNGGHADGDGGFRRHPVPHGHARAAP